MAYDVIHRKDRTASNSAGSSATLAGQTRPDWSSDETAKPVIVDVKKRAASSPMAHVVQVMIYLYAMPESAGPQYRLARLAGEVVYPTHTVRVPKGALPDQFIHNLVSLIRRLAADQPPARIPSRQECRFCDITAADCPDRVDVDLSPEQASTNDF